MVDEPVGRYEVLKMIHEEIARYDEKQDKRHAENTARLNASYHELRNLRDTMTGQLASINTTIAKSTGVQDFKAYIVPALLTLGLLVVGVLDYLKHG